MNTEHLSDKQLQQWALAPNEMETDISAHLNGCADCKQRGENYILLFKGLDQIAVPEFDFDLNGLVMDRLPVAKDRYSYIGLIAIVMALLMLGAAGLVVWPAINGLFERFPPEWTLLLILPVLIGGLIQLISLFYQHKQKMRQLGAAEMLSN